MPGEVDVDTVVILVFTVGFVDETNKNMNYLESI